MKTMKEMKTRAAVQALPHPRKRKKRTLAEMMINAGRVEGRY